MTFQLLVEIGSGHATGSRLPAADLEEDRWTSGLTAVPAPCRAPAGCTPQQVRRQPAAQPNRFSGDVEALPDGGSHFEEDEVDLRRLTGLRNPLSHFSDINDSFSLFMRFIETRSGAEVHLLTDATFVIGMAVRLLSLPAFRVDGDDDC